MDDYELEGSEEVDYDFEGFEEEDRLSELPKSLLFQILSFLPMRDVVRTTFLSKSWEDLWTTVPCLYFWDTDTINNFNFETERFRNFVNRALILWKGTQILKFEIVIEPCFNMYLAGDMDLWVKFAVKNEVQELNIVLSWDDDFGEDVYMAPLRLSSCSSITKLSLVGCSVRIHGSPAWNQLKFLKMHDCYLSGQFISQILLGTPRLEVFDLRIRENNEDLSIQSASLKELRIEKYLHVDVEEQDVPSTDAVLEICCPNLEAFEIAGIPYFNFLLTNVSSLTHAKILSYCPTYYFAHGDELLGETLGQILQFIQHAEKVALSEWCIEVLGASSRKYLLSPLLNFKYLELVVHGGIGLGVAVNTLGIFPNIKMLVIKEYVQIQFYSQFYALGFNALEFETNTLEFETNTSKSFLGQLKTIEIHSFLMYPSQFQFIKFLLKHACMLEKLVVCDLHSTSDESDTQTHFLEVAKVLLNMPRSSPTAEVVFKTK